MKKLLALVLTVIFCLCCLASCDMPRYVVSDILRNQAGAEWLGEITAEDIAEIKMISGGGGPLPPVSKTHISTSQDKEVISSIFEDYCLLEVRSVPEEKTQIADGGYVVVKFILNDGTVKRLSFINGDFYSDGNGNYFELAWLPVFLDGMNFATRYGFERQYYPFQIHLIDETFVCEIPFSEFEFTVLTDDIYLGNELPTHYFEIHGERVYFIRGEYFYIGDNRSVYYQLIGNLDQLIAEYSAEECNHEWDDGIEVEGGSGGYVMEYTCTLCGDKQRETITIIPPSVESHSITYQSDRTAELLIEGFAPTEAKPGDTVVLRTYPLMDADLAFYANGVKLTQTYADYDYWEYVFIMPDDDVVISHEITDGFLPD